MRNGTAAEIELDWFWIRHGATKANREHRYLGKTEEPLSIEGREQLEGLRDKDIFPEEPDVLLTSPMKRCIESAGILFPQESPYFISEWREMDFGRFEGKNYEDLKEDSYYQAWIDSNGTLPFPEGEGQSGFVKRCMAGYERATQLLLSEAVKEKKKRICVASVVHGGTIMAVLSTISGGSYFDYQVKNGGGYRCKILLSREQTKINAITAW